MVVWTNRRWATHPPAPSPDPSESHLVRLEVGPLPLEEPTPGLVLAAPQQHDERVSGDRHFESPADDRDGVAPHAHLDACQLFDDPACLAPSPDEPRPDLGDPVLGVGEVLDIEDLEVGVFVQEPERTIFREPAGYRLYDVACLEGHDRVVCAPF